MFLKKIKFIFIIIIFYQNPLYSKSTSLDEIDTKNLSRYFSGIVAFDKDDNSEALNFFNSSRILTDKHDPYLEKYVYALVLDGKVMQAINLVKRNKDKKNSNFFDAQLLLIINSLKENNFEKAYNHLLDKNFKAQNNFDLAILETLKQYVYVFKEKMILKNKKNFGQLSNISEAFQRCYLGDELTSSYFSNLINDPRGDYTRYVFFYLSHLIENKKINDAKLITKNINYINTTLLLSQGKSWIENENQEKLAQFFSCKNSNDIVSEFFFLISNLYSSQDELKKSNFYLNISNFLNPKFIFNLSLIAENQFSNEEFKKAKKTLKYFKKENDFYFWYRIKKEAQIISKQKNKKMSLKFITDEFNKIEKPNIKFIYDIAAFYKNAQEYDKAIDYYTKIIDTLSDNSEIKPDILYRRGGSYERLGKYDKADNDLLNSLRLNPDNAYVLNYLAYSWLERDYKINEAIKMLEKAYAAESDDPYIIDSIGWAYYLVEDYIKAEEFLKRAVELMPEDPIVNDHYGDILWKLDRKIQARYFWTNVLNMEDVDEKILKDINNKMIDGLENS